MSDFVSSFDKRWQWALFVCLMCVKGKKQTNKQEVACSPCIVTPTVTLKQGSEEKFSPSKLADYSLVIYKTNSLPFWIGESVLKWCLISKRKSIVFTGAQATPHTVWFKANGRKKRNRTKKVPLTGFGVRRLHLVLRAQGDRFRGKPSNKAPPPTCPLKGFFQFIGLQEFQVCAIEKNGKWKPTS